jgi:hypothetical protein
MLVDFSSTGSTGEKKIDQMVIIFGSFCDGGQQ